MKRRERYWIGYVRRIEANKSINFNSIDSRNTIIDDLKTHCHYLGRVDSSLNEDLKDDAKGPVYRFLWPERGSFLIDVRTENPSWTDSNIPAHVYNRVVNIEIMPQTAELPKDLSRLLADFSKHEEIPLKTS